MPLGLGVAYKMFTGGHSTVYLYTPSRPNPTPGYYALTPLPMGSFSIMDNSIFLDINASAEFMAAALTGNVPVPSPADLPQAYGFNTLLLDTYSAALLDMPEPKYVDSILSGLSTGEAYTLSATVNATVARMDQSFVNQQNNDAFWNSTWQQAAGFGYLSSTELYQPNSTCLGLMLAPDYSATTGPYCLIGFYKNCTAYGIDQFSNDSIDAQLFRDASPWKYDIQREQCTGTWRISREGVALTEGYCPGRPVSQLIWGNTVPFYVDSMPILSLTIGTFSPEGKFNSSAWKLPAMVTAVTTMYWSRMIFMNDYPGSSSWIKYEDTYYPATNETVTSTVATLRANWLLYLVVTVQPLMTVVSFVAMIFLYRTPVARGFGITALMAGLDRAGLEYFRGAALSGEVDRPVGIRIVTVDAGTEAERAGEVRYYVEDPRHSNEPKLKKGRKYA